MQSGSFSTSNAYMNPALFDSSHYFAYDESSGHFQARLQRSELRLKVPELSFLLRQIRSVALGQITDISNERWTEEQACLYMCETLAVSQTIVKRLELRSQTWSAHLTSSVRIVAWSIFSEVIKKTFFSSKRIQEIVAEYDERMFWSDRVVHLQYMHAHALQLNLEILRKLANCLQIPPVENERAIRKSIFTDLSSFSLEKVNTLANQLEVSNLPWHLSTQ